MLLRGTQLRNTSAVVGLVVYTGKETRIQMNALRTPLKTGGAPGCGAGSRHRSGAVMPALALRCPTGSACRIHGAAVPAGSSHARHRDEAPCPAPVPAGSFDRFLNLQISLIIAMQLSMCLFLSVASLIWVDNVGVDHYYLALTTFTQVGWVHTPLPGTGGS